MTDKIKAFVERTDHRAGRWFDISIQVVIVVSLISFSVETLPNLSAQWRYILRVIEVVAVIIFTIEYLLRLWVADSSLRFVFSFFGIVDLLAILPFYITSGVDLRSIRVMRLFRLVRLLKLFRYNKAIQDLRSAFYLIREELVLFMVATLFLLYISSVGIYYFEKAAQPENFSSIFHALWWAVATLTTVGYGDVYPVTVGGKVFTFCILMIGLGIVAIPSGLLASALTKIAQRNQKEQDGEEEVSEDKQKDR